MAKEKDIGALWVKQGAKGQYLSGYVEIDGQKHPIVCFLNSYKKEAKHPDYRILKSEKQAPRERTEEEQRAPLNEESGGDDLLDVPF